MKASDFDKKFDDNENILEHLELTQAHKPALESRRVNVDFPAWMVDALDREAKRMGVPRQSIIKIWLAERLEHNKSPLTDAA
jgi:hypothetical protein